MLPVLALGAPGARARRLVALLATLEAVMKLDINTASVLQVGSVARSQTGVRGAWRVRRLSATRCDVQVARSVAV